MANPNISLLGATYSEVSGVTLPKQGGGTATFPWVEGSQTITQNNTYDVTNLAEVVVNVSGGGGSGLEYETGTYTPATDIARPTISFANTHSKFPIAVIMADADGYTSTTNTGLAWAYYSYEQLIGGSIAVSTSSRRYGEVRCTYRGTSASEISASNVSINASESTTSESSNSYPRYWVMPDSFRPYPNSASRYWRAGRTYKWIAVWKPTS